MKYTYHVDKGGKLEPKNIFVVDHSSLYDCNKGRIMTYCPIGQHSEADINYVLECRRIRKSTYLKHSKGLYTPEEYLK